MNLKITIFQRLFWSSQKIQDYLLANMPAQVSDGEIQTLKAFNASLTEQLKIKDGDIADLKERNTTLFNELNQIKYDNESKNREIQLKDSSISSLNASIAEIKTRLSERERENQIIKEDISKKLETINKIEKTFFAQTGNKGTAELGEQQVKSILLRSGMTEDFWIENLPVGSGSVEFAIKFDETEKWIPVDSKVLMPKLDENKMAIIDTEYAKRVHAKAKEISKYLGKKNTSNYGILVLQSDDIYMKLYDQDPAFFNKVLVEEKIQIASPSIFVQAAWSISNIMDIYDRVHKDEKIYEEMIDTLATVEKFANKLQIVHKDFNTAMVKWYPSIENKTNDLSKRLIKNGKLSEVKALEIKNKDEE